MTTSLLLLTMRAVPELAQEVVDLPADGSANAEDVAGTSCSAPAGASASDQPLAQATCASPVVETER